MIGNVEGGGCIFPVGAIYMSLNNTNPATLFGGTWQRIQDRFLFAADDDFYVSGKVGGEEVHTLTVEEMPAHNHALYGALTGKNEALSNTGNNWAQTTTDWKQPKYIEATGGGQAHNNMPPYLAVYMWTRIS